MRFFGKNNPSTAATKPFNPLESPPIGSEGDEWDAHLEFPRHRREDLRAEASRQREREQQRKEQLSQINAGTLEIIRPWHVGVVAALSFLLMALTSTGATGFLRMPMAAGAILCGAVAIYRIQNYTVFHRGVVVAATVSVLALGVVVAEAMLLLGHPVPILSSW